MEELVLRKRRAQLEEEVVRDQYNYDLWFDYTRLEEQAPVVDIEKVREIYERAIANQPLIQEKIHWRRYIYLWINYAVFEETQAKDIERTKKIYEKLL
jgi:crooked neck